MLGYVYLNFDKKRFVSLFYYISYFYWTRSLIFGSFDNHFHNYIQLTWLLFTSLFLSVVLYDFESGS